MKKVLNVLMTGMVLCSASACRATTLPEIVLGVSVQSYTSFHAGLFVADGNSRGFSNGGSPRVPDYQHDLARDFIHSNFTAMGYDTWLDPFTFTYSGYEYINCNNVVAVKWGSGGTNVYMVGAHYDSVDNGQPGITNNIFYCPGADDNASGTAALLEAAKAIKDYVFRDTIVFIAFDAEEKDYKGATHFVQQHITDMAANTNATTFLKSSIKAMVNLDTIAYDDPGTSYGVVIGRVSGPPTSVTEALVDAVTTYTSLVPFQSEGYNSSDHIQFTGISTAHIIEYDYKDYSVFPDAGTNPFNHTALDSVDTPGNISYPYATEITRALVGAICDNVGVIPPATLTQSVTNGNTLEISWLTAPDVSYSLLGADSLLQTNAWTLIEVLPPTNATVEYSVHIDLATASQTVFKVESH